MSTTPPPPQTNEHDADLDDLLREESSQQQKQNHSLEMTPLNLDYLTKGQLDVVSSGSSSGHGGSPNKKKSSTSSTQQSSDICLLIQGSCTYIAYSHPKLCSLCAIATIALLFFGLWEGIMNPSITFGDTMEDFSSVNSQYDLKQGNIDHWCLRGDDDSCRCEDPLVPTSRGEFQTWTKAHHANKDLLAENKGTPVKVAFVGESLVEEMNGRWMGQTRGPQLETMSKMFSSTFSVENGVPGVALGIAGDTSPNVLWRLMHGEMPDWFNPDVWWISLGMNDLGRMQCSEEVVVMGILRVVEEILETKPTARVVINSMLPMADLRGGIYPHVRDYQDAFSKMKDTRFVKKPSNNNNRNLRKKKVQPEEEEGEDPANPEKLDKKTLKRYKRKDPINPLLDPNETKMKKYQLFQKNRLPLWTSIYAINKELSKFCSKHERVSFFDATSIFASRVERGKYMLKSDMISIRGHPTVTGYRKMEDAMLKRLQSMLAEEEKEKEVVKYTVDDTDDDITDSSSGSSSSRSKANRKGAGKVSDSSSSESSKNSSGDKRG